MADRLTAHSVAFQAVLTWLANHGRAAEALQILDRHLVMGLENQRIEWLTMTDRHAEAVAIYQRRGDLASRLHAALLMLDLGQMEQAARDLESWASSAESSQQEVEQILPVLSLLRSPVEMQMWKGTEAMRFPDSRIFKPAASQKSGTVAKNAIELRLEKIQHQGDLRPHVCTLWQMHREHPADTCVSSLLMKSLMMAGRSAELWALARVLELEVADAAGRLEVWRQMLPLVSLSGRIELQMRENSAEYWLALAEWQQMGNPAEVIPSLEQAMRLAPADARIKSLYAEALLSSDRLDELPMLASTPRPSLELADFRRGQPGAVARALLVMAHDLT